MELITELPNNIQQALDTEHDKALMKLVHDRSYTYQLPMHPIPMNLKQNVGDDKIQTVLLPDLSLYIDLTKIDGDMLSRDAIEYRIASNNAPLPVSHIYNSSGWICLGNLFVPSLISKYSPQQPLETLLLYNDRNLHHGDPKIIIHAYQQRSLEIYMDEKHLELDSYTTNFKNWVANDTLWKMSHEVLTRYPLPKAKSIMRDIYAIVFDKQNTFITL